MKFSTLFLALAFGLGATLAVSAAPKPEQTVDMAEVLKPGPLPELTVGPATGVPVVEYFSVTCPHCAAFEHEVWPKFKTAYVDNGKVRYIFREFSRNPLDVAAFVLARCIGGDDTSKTLAVIDLEFATQDKWAFTENPLDPLLDALRPTGLGKDKAMACLKDNALIGKVRAIGETANKVVKVQGTPTFVIDGKSYGGELSMADFDELLKPLVK
jgi:protein-disulfide isomerase